MPRSNRYILSGCAYHVTHRCHNRSFLLRFGLDRTEYVKRLRAALHQFPVDLLCFCITSNHTHLLLTSEHPTGISALMQKLEGEFAEYYNLRKRRAGAFWGDRFHCTMIDSGTYLWNCMAYIELNMVRAGVVMHPADWPWCSYHELMGRRQRYRLVARERLLERLGGCDARAFEDNYKAVIERKLGAGEVQRESFWTESIAVGTEMLIRRVQNETQWRVRFDIRETPANGWTIREATEPYG